MSEQQTVHNSIAVFDSGVGGLTIVKELKSQLPSENIIYFGDTAHVPYGNKSVDAIRRYAKRSIEFLLRHPIKLLIIGCNTVSAVAMEYLHNYFSIPILGVIASGVKEAIAVSENKRIGVIGTHTTIESKVYQNRILQKVPKAHIQAIACPLFVPLIEEKMLPFKINKLIVKSYLLPLKDSQIDTLILGCTHYPLLQNLIQEVMGAEVHLINSASSLVKVVKAFLEKHHLANPNISLGEHQYFVSDDPKRFTLLGSQFIGHSLDQVRGYDDIFN